MVEATFLAEEKHRSFCHVNKIPPDDPCEDVGPRMSARHGFSALLTVGTERSRKSIVGYP